MKPYLLIAGNQYYPSADTYDWVGCFKTIEKAESHLDEMRKRGECVDWYSIVDLRYWTNDDNDENEYDDEDTD